ncbi:hypothetical protein LCGC14_0695630 [marine sediment metagenome]|uniref:Glycoside hydrolase family 31 N-terminal domain-containing protein n=1 Tax=marine sediment metagenome TaxID=412755 RepID=A0A0F9QJ99_9ZZZZ
MRIFHFLYFSVLFLSTTLQAQTDLGSFESVLSIDNNTITLATTQATIKVEFITKSTVRIRAAWDGKFEENEPWMVIKYDWPEVLFTKTETDADLSYATNEILVKLTKNPFSIAILDKKGDTLITGQQNSPIGVGFVTNDTIGAQFKLDANEHFFGFGERMDFLDRRGKKVRLNVGRGQGLPHVIGAYNPLEANYSPVPFFYEY